MSQSERNELLSRWIKPSSDDEQKQQERAERMVREAIKAHPAFAGAGLKVYSKGSYPNNTNVRRDSDVDVVVECTECIYYDSYKDVAPPVKCSAYTGLWTPEKWRDETRRALVAKFGSSDVDPGEIAIKISAVQGSRPSADVVPCFTFQRYWKADGSDYSLGTKVFKRGGGSIINWPQQQFDNGRKKNTDTGGRYKNYVRALKNAENRLAAAGTIDDLPSYFMECLVWNVPNATLQHGNLVDGFARTLGALWSGLKDDGGHVDWDEPNRLKYLFRGTQGWTVAQARELVLETWNYLGYGD